VKIGPKSTQEWSIKHAIYDEAQGPDQILAT
jgi:hypothetical protein